METTSNNRNRALAAIDNVGAGVIGNSLTNLNSRGKVFSNLCHGGVSGTWGLAQHPALSCL